MRAVDPTSRLLRISWSTACAADDGTEVSTYVRLGASCPGSALRTWRWVVCVILFVSLPVSDRIVFRWQGTASWKLVILSTVAVAWPNSVHREWRGVGTEPRKGRSVGAGPRRGQIECIQQGDRIAVAYSPLDYRLGRALGDRSFCRRLTPRTGKCLAPPTRRVYVAPRARW